MSDRVDLFEEKQPCSEYRVERREHGVAIFGSPPLPEVTALMKTWKEKYGYDRLAVGIGHAIGASFVGTDEEGQKAWRSEIGDRLEEAFSDPLDQWVRGCTTGISSLTIYSVLRDVPFSAVARSGSPDVPYDAADFKRCVQLLEAAPDRWRDRLSEVADAYPRWEPIVERWEQLERLLEEDQKRCTEMLREVRDG